MKLTGVFIRRITGNDKMRNVGRRRAVCLRIYAASLLRMRPVARTDTRVARKLRPSGVSVLSENAVGRSFDFPQSDNLAEPARVYQKMSKRRFPDMKQARPRPGAYRLNKLGCDQK